MAPHRERKGLRQTFDRASEVYHRARPDYPEELIDHLIRVTSLRQGDHLLEIGCGTGKATLPLARRGFRITCVELSARLAESARQNLSDYPDVEVVDRIFEHWPPAGSAVRSRLCCHRLALDRSGSAVPQGLGIATP